MKMNSVDLIEYIFSTGNVHLPFPVFTLLDKKCCLTLNKGGPMMLGDLGLAK